MDSFAVDKIELKKKIMPCVIRSKKMFKQLVAETVEFCDFTQSFVSLLRHNASHCLAKKITSK